MFILRRAKPTLGCRADDDDDDYDDDDDDDDDMYFVYEKALQFEIILVGYVMRCSFVEMYPSGGEG